MSLALKPLHDSSLVSSSWTLTEFVYCMSPARWWHNLQHGRTKFSPRLWIWDFLPELVFSWLGIVSVSFQRLVPLPFQRRLWFCEWNVSQVPESPVKTQGPGHGTLPTSVSHSTHLMTRKRYFRKMGSIGLLRWLSRWRHLMWKPWHPGSDPQNPLKRGKQKHTLQSWGLSSTSTLWHACPPNTAYVRVYFCFHFYEGGYCKTPLNLQFS